MFRKRSVLYEVGEAIGNVRTRLYVKRRTGKPSPEQLLLDKFRGKTPRLSADFCLDRYDSGESDTVDAEYRVLGEDEK